MNLAKNDLTKNVGDILLQSIADLQVAQAAAHPNSVINDAIECLIEQLAALCLEHLEGGVNASMRNRSEEIDVKV